MAGTEPTNMMAAWKRWNVMTHFFDVTDSDDRQLTKSLPLLETGQSLHDFSLDAIVLRDEI